MKIKILLIYLLLSFNLFSQKYNPTQENLEAREWFKNAKFGLFIHWGVYSVLGDGEWVMQNQNISIKDYEKLPAFFNPIDFNPKEWVKMAKESGMKYITITSRHHDGFSMFKTKANNYNIVNATPFKKDILKMLAEECHKEGIKLFFYYSLLDWHNDDYFPRGRTGNGIKGRKEGDWTNYINFMKIQLTELLTNYGEIAGIWFDGHWDQKEWDGKTFGKLKVDWHYDEIYKLIHDIQPQCLIGNNHHIGILDGEDFQMFEKDLPGNNTTGFGSSKEDISQLPLEVCETINNSWGFNLQDNSHKSKKELIQYLVKASGHGTNLLLNVGPMPNGKIQSNHISSLKEIGNWLTKNGETIYNTSQGPILPTEEYVSTQKQNKIYLHIMNPKKNTLFIDSFTKRIKKIKYFDSNEKVNYNQNKFGLIIDLSNKKIDPIDTIIEIEL